VKKTLAARRAFGKKAAEQIRLATSAIAAARRAESTLTASLQHKAAADHLERAVAALRALVEDEEDRASRR
jgi:hypothetical protein